MSRLNLRLCFIILCVFLLLYALEGGNGASASPAVRAIPQRNDGRPPRRSQHHSVAVSPRGPTTGFQAEGVLLFDWLPLFEFGPGVTSGNSCWGYTSPSGREYALMGLSTGTSFVEVTDPANASIVALMSGPTSTWRDMKVYQDHAYSISEGGSGIQVFDLSQIDNGVVMQVNIVTAAGLLTTPNTHTLALDEQGGFLYRCGGSNSPIPPGLRIYSLADPAAPAFVGEWHDRYVHEAQVVTYTSGPYAGKQVAFCFTGSNGTLDILDVTDKSNILLLGSTSYSNAAFSHQGWLSADRQYLYLDDEFDESNFSLPSTTHILDVSDLQNPFEVTTFTNGLSAVDHNLYVKGTLIFASNYRSGLRVFDIASPLAPQEIAYFDTYPSDDLPNFSGLWNNYPFFASGTIIGSDIQSGLFVWRLGDVLLSFDYPNGRPALFDPSGDTLLVSISSQAGGQLEAGTAKLHYDTGSGYGQADLIPAGTDLFEAVFPAGTCGQSVSYYFTAQDTLGTPYRDPALAPGETFSAAFALAAATVAQDTMEVDNGWVVGAPGDNATSGQWVRVDPNGTSAQPENDHTPDPASICWVTGQGPPGGGAGVADVDSGRTTLVSAALGLAGLANPAIGYWRWFSNNGGGSPSEDVFVVEISSDGGANWINVETVGPSGFEAGGGWLYHQFSVEHLLGNADAIQLRFIAADMGAGSLVEAAVDDLQILDLVCSDCNANGVDDSADLAAHTSTDCNQSGIPDDCEGLEERLYADIAPADGDGTVDVGDMLCCLDGFADEALCPGADVHPCIGNGFIDVGDVLAVLEAFAGTPACPNLCIDVG